MKAIYKYHSLGRQWGDIGYNYVIWYNGEIFEWRAWGDYVVWAHALWNNRSTVGISVMGNYTKKPISEKQYTALKNLVRYLAYKYWINLNDTFPLHEDCSWKDCPLGIKTQDYYTLAWHRDGGITSCPWNDLYKQMQKIREEVQYETRLYTPIKNPLGDGK
jgi:N-acetyl-anhydromuramyl-L-alanine amidase AmpD